MESKKPLLKVDDIGKYFTLTKGFVSRTLFGSRILKAVDHVSFHVCTGETLALVGESGCGKSTVARLITRLIEPDFGTVYFKGIDLFALKDKEMRRVRKEIQMVFQEQKHHK